MSTSRTERAHKAPVRMVGASLALAVSLSGAATGAQERVRSDVLAESLFQEARELIAAGKPALACPKLAESYKLDSAGGTALLLALCYEQVGKTASAWVRFNDALALARKDGRTDREARAKERIAVLEPNLSRLTVSVDDATRAIEGLIIRLDDSPMPSVAWGRALPTDPGPHAVSASAPGMRPWSASIEVGPNADRVTLSVPALEPIVRDAPRAAVTAPAPATPARDRPSAQSSAGTTAAYVVGGLGILSLGAGGYFGYVALDRNADARDRCATNECSDMSGVQANEDARRAAIRADIFTGAGVVLAGVGVVLWLTADEGESSPGAALVVRPTQSGGGGTVGAVGRF